MKPIKFNECNVTYGNNQSEYMPLPAYLENGEKGQVVTCWELTDEEIENIVKTKKIYHSQLTFNSPLQPIFITVNKEDVFISPKDDKEK